MKKLINENKNHVKNIESFKTSGSNIPSGKCCICMVSIYCGFVYGCLTKFLTEKTWNKTQKEFWASPVTISGEILLKPFDKPHRKSHRSKTLLQCEPIGVERDLPQV